jgi:HlyD family secretion protein
LKKVILITLVCLLGLGVLIAAVVLVLPRMSVSGAGRSTGSGTPVRIDLASTGELIEIVSAPGTVTPQTKVSISARVSARIVDLPLRVGDPVTKGNPKANPPVEPSLLVKLDDTDLRAELRGTEARYLAQAAELETAKARLDAQSNLLTQLRVELENEQKNLSRQMKLLETGDVSQQIVDNLRTRVAGLVARLNAEEGNQAADRKRLAVLEAQVQAALAEVDQRKQLLTYATITSPIDGVVTQRNAEVGELAIVGTMNNPGTQIMEVADLSKMLVKVRVDEADVARVAVGQPAKVRIQAYPDMIFNGVVQTVALSKTRDAVDRSESYETEVLLDTTGQAVLSGLAADADIESRRHQNVIRVPSQAVLGRLTDELPADIRNSPEVDLTKTITTVVYRMIDNKAVITPVRVGPSDLTHTIILAGLKTDEPVITGPFKILDSLRHDQAVRREDSDADRKKSPDANQSPEAESSEPTEDKSNSNASNEES